jgi:hypothetical protein
MKKTENERMEQREKNKGVGGRKTAVLGRDE